MNESKEKSVTADALPKMYVPPLITIVKISIYCS